MDDYDAVVHWELMMTAASPQGDLSVPVVVIQTATTGKPDNPPLYLVG